MIQTLLQYQDVDRDLRKIELEIANSEERKKASTAKNFLLESEENAGKIDRRAEELINIYKKAKDNFDGSLMLINEYDNTIRTLKSEDELSYLAKKVNQVLDNIKNLERDITAVLKDMEDVSKSFSEFRNKYNAAKKDYVENKEKLDKLKSEKAGAMEIIKKKLEELAKKIDPKILEKYNRKRGDRIFPVLVPARSNMCGGCSMEISLKGMSKLNEEKIIECENCRRLIYING